VDGLEAIVVVMGIEQGQLLAAVDPVGSIVDILGLGCMGVSVPLTADPFTSAGVNLAIQFLPLVAKAAKKLSENLSNEETFKVQYAVALQQPIELGAKCKADFDNFLDWDPHYKVFAYAYDAYGLYACGMSTGAEEALKNCNNGTGGDWSPDSGSGSGQGTAKWSGSSAFPPGTTGDVLGGCKIYAESPIDGKLAIVWKEDENRYTSPTVTAEETPDTSSIAELCQQYGRRFIWCGNRYGDVDCDEVLKQQTPSPTVTAEKQPDTSSIAELCQRYGRRFIWGGNRYGDVDCDEVLKQQTPPPTVTAEKARTASTPLGFRDDGAREGHCYVNYGYATSWLSKAPCNQSGGIVVQNNGQLATCQNRRLTPRECYQLIYQYTSSTVTAGKTPARPSDLIVRQFPGNEALEIARLPQDQTLIVERQTADGWSYIKFSNGRHGYVRLTAEKQAEARARQAAIEAKAKQQQLIQAQTALKSLDLYDGKADGFSGPKTNTAINRWLKANGLAEGIALTEALVARMAQQVDDQIARRLAAASAEKESKLAAARAVEQTQLAAAKAENERKLAKARAAEKKQLAAVRAVEQKRLAEQNKVLNALRKEHRHAVAVIIGNRDYAGRTPDVAFAGNDADAVRQFVIDNLGYREGNIIDLRDATLTQLNATFGTADNHKGQLFDYVRAGKSDVVVYYSGHGVPGLRDRKGYLLPVNADPNRAELNGYPLDTLLANLGKIPARSMAVYLDACFSGESAKGTLVQATSGITVQAKIPRASTTMVVVTAARNDQFASWDEDAKHGLFTKHLLAALRGKADGAGFGNGDGKVTLAELKSYLDEEMTYQARRRWSRDQNASIQGDLNTVLATQK